MADRRRRMDKLIVNQVRAQARQGSPPKQGHKVNPVRNGHILALPLFRSLAAEILWEAMDGPAA